VARLEFDDGENWVEVKELDQLTEGDRKAVARAVSVGVEGNRGVIGGSMYDDMRDAMYRNIVLNWSFREPLPHRTLSGLNKLPISVARELAKLTEPWFKLLTGADDDQAGDGEADPTDAESQS
jgi:hypothetical protein